MSARLISLIKNSIFVVNQTIITMKELLKELGFEHLPMLSEFVESVRMNNSGSPFPEEQAEIDSKELVSIFKYCNFITQPLTKGMFIPCDENGNVLVEPEKWCESWSFEKKQETSKLNEQYQQAVDRVLFEGWELSVNVHGMTMFEKDGFTIAIDNDEQLPTTINTGRSLELCETIEQAINARVKFILK